MDASFLNFHQEETFQAFHSTSYYLDDIYGDLNDQNYGWDSERELNSDMGGTPPSELAGSFSDRSASPQHVEIDNLLLLERWTQHISSLEIPNVPELSDVCGSIQTGDAQEVFSNNVFCDKLLDKDSTLGLSSHFESVDPIGHLINSDFDITKYVNEPDVRVEESAVKGEDAVPKQPGGKKIDMKNCRYIVKEEAESEEDIDVETLSECGDAKNNLLSLDRDDSKKCVEADNAEVTSFDIDSTIIQAGDLVSLLEQFEATEKGDAKTIEIPCKSKGKKIKKTEESVKQHVKTKDKQIPVKHIKVKEKVKTLGKPARMVIKKAGKVVDKKLKACPKLVKNVSMKSSINNNQQKVDLATSKVEKKSRIIKEIPVIQSEHVQKVVEPKKVIKKDQKAKQENQVVLKKLPAVKQLIETNITNTKPVIKTIDDKSNVNNTMPKQIPTQNLVKSIRLDHDYCALIQHKNHTAASHANQHSILRNQPTVKMADGKLMVSLLKVNTIKTADTKKKLNLEEYKKRRQNRLGSNDRKPVSSDKFWGLDPYPKLPQNLEMKTYVSIGVNTDQSWAKIQELTKGNGINFSPNSLIASMVERLPSTETQIHIAENKTIVYLDKNRPKKHTSNKRVQTVFERRRSRVSSSSSNSSRSSRSSSRSVSPANRKRRRTSSERIKEIEERRVIYVGRIANGTTQEDLRRRFYKFGPINYISVHFRRGGDNYGFVTFRYKEDAYEAVEHGNDDPTLPHYDLSFGGRRVFCKTSYSDLDNMKEEYAPHLMDDAGGTFEDLLRDFQATVRNKKVRSS